MATRRQVLPRQVFTPTQHTPPPSHYLLVFENTDSYQIAARSSLKQIDGDVVFIMIRNKLVKAKTVCNGSFEDCNAEYIRLTRASSQNEIVEEDDHESEDDNAIVADSYMKDIMYSKTNALNSSTTSPPTSQVLTHIQSSQIISDEEEEISSDDEENTFFDCRKRRRKHSLVIASKKKKQRKNLTTHLSTDANDENVQNDTTENSPINRKKKSKIEIDSDILECIDNRVSELSNKLISNSSKFDQQMQRMCVKLDRLASTVNVNQHALEPFIDKSGEYFPPDLMFDKIDLLAVMATDYGDYARQILRIIFTSDELKNSILPPGKSYLARQPLDEKRFKTFTDAVRYKFKLNSINFGLFYRSLLRRKLTDFLIEERRREPVKKARQSLKQDQTEQRSQSNFD